MTTGNKVNIRKLNDVLSGPMPNTSRQASTVYHLYTENEITRQIVLTGEANDKNHDN